MVFGEGESRCIAPDELRLLDCVSYMYVESLYDASSGGFIFKYDNDNIDEGDEVFRSSASGLQFIMREPKGSRDNGALQWIRRWMSVLEGHLQGIRNNSSDSIGDFPLSHCMDMGALVDYFLLTELTKNPDGDAHACCLAPHSP